MPHIPYEYGKRPTETVIHHTHSCGIGEIDYLGLSKEPLDALRSIAVGLHGGHRGFHELSWRNAPRFVTFSGSVSRDKRDTTHHDGYRTDNYGQLFADYLLSNNLGTVISTPEAINWTYTHIKMWVWTPDYANLDPFLKGHGIDAYATLKTKWDAIMEESRLRQIEEERDRLNG